MASISRVFRLQRSAFSRAAASRLGSASFSTSSLLRGSYPVQSVSPLAPIGVNAAIQAATDPSVSARPKIFNEFTLSDRVAIVSGGNRGLGLEMAMALCEAGARAVYCLDLPKESCAEWQAARDFIARMDHGSRLEYVSCDVTDQKRVWAVVEEIGDKEKRVDICVAAAGILMNHIDCLEYPEDEFRKVMDVNTNGVLFTAQAAGRQMRRFGIPGSIILVASMSGSLTNRGHSWVSYNTSKSACLQMARSMACELGKEGIRVNSLSPGHIFTALTMQYLDKHPTLLDKWSNLNPMGRIGRPDELRGVITWLASDASTFCTGSDILVDGGHHAW